MELNFFVSKLIFNQKDFLFCQLQWGHKKLVASSFLNLHILGFKNDFAIFNTEHLLEYLKRCLLFSFKAIFNNGCLFFLNICDSYKKINTFFCLKSLQVLSSNKWVNGTFTNNSFEMPLVLLTVMLNNNIIKEAFKKLILVISFEDSSFSFSKSSFPILGNDSSKKSVYFFYTFFSSFLLKCFLLKYLKGNGY